MVNYPMRHKMPRRRSFHGDERHISRERSAMKAMGEDRNVRFEEWPYIILDGRCGKTQRKNKQSERYRSCNGRVRVVATVQISVSEVNDY